MSITVNPDTISEAVLDPNDHLVLVVPQTFQQQTVNGYNTREMQYDLIFFEVQSYATLDYEPYNLHDDTGSAVGNIASDSGQAFQRLYDSNGDDILRIEHNENPWYIYHYSLEVSQSDIWIYPRIPEEDEQPGFTWAVGSPDPTKGDTFGKQRSQDGTYKDPPIELEAVSFKSGKISHNQYGFYNNSSNAVTPDINIKGRTYLTAPVTDSQRQKDILSRLSHNKRDVRAVSYGPVTSTFSLNYPDDWDNVGNILSSVQEFPTGSSSGNI